MHTLSLKHLRGNAGVRPQGFSLIEVLISIIIVAIGLLGLAGLQAQAMNAEFESYQRVQAIMLVNDMVERIRMNRGALGTFKAISDPATGGGYVGTTGASEAVLTCPPTAPTAVGTAETIEKAQYQAALDLCEWRELLKGSTETKSGNKVGAMIGARGCIWYDASTELAAIPDSGLVFVAVAWQGSQATVPSSVMCGTGLYGTETLRRVVTQSFRLARLN